MLIVEINFRSVLF